MAIQPGTIIGRYHIIEALGQGGMATVYRAYDTRLKKDVAFKVIRRTAFSEEIIGQMLLRFEQEAVSLARLTHTNIIPIIDYDQYEDAPFLVMPFIPGGTLKDRIQQMAAQGITMRPAEAARLLVPVARALAHAHENDVLHRDVKPANILITVSGDPMLSDFGIARILDVAGNTITGTGMSVGTPEYMAPEQWLGKPEPASDQYGLGVIFYELVTGHRPYIADTPPAVMMKHITEPLPPPRQYTPDLPQEVERALFTALAKQPENRYASMADFAQALERLALLDWEKPAPPVIKTPAPAPQPADKPVEINPVAEPETAAVESPAVEPAPGDSDETLPWPIPGPRPEPEPELAPEHEPEPRPKPGPPDGGPANRRWLLIAGGLVAVLALILAFVLGLPGISPNPPATQVAAAQTQAAAAETQAASPTSEPVIDADHIPQFKRQFMGHKGPVRSVAFSPDGQTLASGSDDKTVRLWLLESGINQNILTGSKGIVFQVAFSPDGHHVAAATDENTYWIWQVPDGEPESKWHGHASDVFSVAYSPDGQWIASGSADNAVRLWPSADYRAAFTMQGHNGDVYSIAFSPDGQILASGSEDQTVRLWQVSDGSLIHTFQGHTGKVNSVAFSPDGELVASASDDGTFRLWRAADYSLTAAIEAHLNAVTSVAFSPDGEVLATGSLDQTIKLWRVADGALLATLEGHTGGVTSVAFTPDGKSLASAAQDYSIRLWTVAQEP